MPFDGNGNFYLVTGNPVVTGTTISSTVQNNTESDIAAGLTNCVTRNGQSVATNNLPMGTFKHTNVGNATARNQYAAAGQVQDNGFSTLSGNGGTSDAITAITIPPITAYVQGQEFILFPTAANTTTTPTIAISGLTAITIQKGGLALAANDLVIGVPATLIYDGTNFQLQTPAQVALATNVTGIVAVAHGGTNASTAATARTNLGVAIGSNVEAWSAQLDAVSALAGTGIISQTAANTPVVRTITGTAGTITVTNGSGVSGNPTLTIDATYVGQASITTIGTISTGTVPAAHVSGLAASATTDTTTLSNITSGTLAGGTVPVARVSGLAVSATTDTTNASNITSGTLPVAQTPAYSGGNVTKSSGSGVLTIGAGQVTNAMHASVANNTVSGNVSGGSAAPSDLSTAQLTTLVNQVTTTLSGAVPATGGSSTSKFLRADLTWSSPTFGFSHAANGYEILASGLILQWGTATGSVGGGGSPGSNSITFPIAFASACYSVTLTGLTSPSTVILFTTTTSGFTYGNGVGGASTKWWAVGV